MSEPRHPDISDPRLQVFADLLSPGSVASLVKVREVGSSVELDCFENVRKYCETHGGTVQYGWRISELPEAFFEAEFHAVWLGSTSMLDVSPPILEGNRTVFVPDSSRQYYGRQICNEFFPLRPSPAVTEYIQIFGSIYEHMNAGALADYHGEVRLGPAMQSLYARLADAWRRIELGQ